MRRAILTAILVLMLSIAVVASSEAAFYVGGGKGIRVAFRVKGHKLVQADVVARLYCVGPRGRRHFDRIKEEYAFPDVPLRVDRRGRFRWDTRGEPQEEGLTLEELLVGRIGPDLVTGRYEYFRSLNFGRRRVRCRTGSYPLRPGKTEVPFRARRQVGRS
jgi:hypothetical protein